MAKAFGIITSSPEYKVQGMQDHRPIAAFSFLGRYRVIDFPVSNFSNSNIDRIQIYISSKPHSLVDHVGTGRHYNINSKRGKIQLFFPADEATSDIYNTNLNALRRNVEYIERMSEEYVVIAPSCMIFVQDFDELLQKHLDSGADITLLYHNVKDAKVGYATCEVVNIGPEGRVTSITQNLSDEDEANIFTGSYVMKKSLLLDLIEKTARISSTYTLVQAVSHFCGDLDVRAVEHKGYFRPITDLRSYYDGNMAVLDQDVADSLFIPGWPIYTRTNDSCPTQYFKGSSVKNSLVSNGSEISGTVEDSIVGRNVKIAEGAVVKGCVLLAYAEIGEGVHLENQVVDKYARITSTKEIISNKERPGYIRYNDVL